MGVISRTTNPIILKLGQRSLNNQESINIRFLHLIIYWLLRYCDMIFLILRQNGGSLAWVFHSLVEYVIRPTFKLKADTHVGNDQVRFELAFLTIDPKIKIIGLYYQAEPHALTQEPADARSALAIKRVFQQIPWKK
jgi:hypothetical protein